MTRLDGITDSMGIHRVWVSSESWWWTGRPDMLQSMVSQRVGHDWATELNWLNRVWRTFSKVFTSCVLGTVCIKNSPYSWEIFHWSHQCSLLVFVLVDHSWGPDEFHICVSEAQNSLQGHSGLRSAEPKEQKWAGIHRCHSALRTYQLHALIKGYEAPADIWVACRFSENISYGFI